MWQSRHPFLSPARAWSLWLGGRAWCVRNKPMTAWSFSMRLPRFCRRFTSLSNCVVVLRVSGGGGGGGSGPSVLGLGFLLAKLDPQPSEQFVLVGVAREVLAGVGVAEGLAGPGVGDMRPGARRDLVGLAQLR